MQQEQATAYLDQVFTGVRDAIVEGDDARLTRIVRKVRDDGYPAAADAVLDTAVAVRAARRAAEGAQP